MTVTPEVDPARADVGAACGTTLGMTYESKDKSMQKKPVRFRIQMGGGTTLENHIFTNISTALGFFDDKALNLGNWSSGLTGDLDIKFMLDLTTNDLNSAFALDLVFGNSTYVSAVPEPSTIALLGIGMAGMYLRRRSKRRQINKR